MNGIMLDNIILYVILYISAFCVFLSDSAPSKQPTTVPGVHNDGQPQQHMSEWLLRDGSKKIDWNKMAKDRLDHMLKHSPFAPTKAKNVILFVGDGLSVSTITAARFYAMQKYNKTLTYDYFPMSGLSKTYNVDSQTPDSAGTATALLGGEKTKKTIVGLDQDAEVGKCVDVSKNKIDSILKKAIRQNKWTGFVTTTRVTHATPAATYAHTAHRDWESDAQRDALLMDTADTSHCPDIASQLIDDPVNQKIKVILGGGRSQFYPINVTDPENPKKMGLRTDNRTLPEVWLQQKLNMGVSQDKVKYVWRKDEFDAVDPDKTEYLMGLFEPSHMQWEADRKEDIAGEPSIADMVEKALRILKKSKDGFFLLVEGGRIDHAHHVNFAVKALEDTVAMSEAIRKAQTLTSEEDTLIVSTADHSHVFAMNGYTYISNDITGLAKQENGSNILMFDQKPYTTLSYANGPGFLNHRTDMSSKNASVILEINENDVHPRINLTGNSDIGNKDFFYDTAMYRNSETHSGEDVGVFASGPMSHLLTGTFEQNYISHVMMYAACIKPYVNRQGCNPVENESHKTDSGSADIFKPYTLGLFLAAVVCFFVNIL